MRIALAKDRYGLGKPSEGCDLKYSEGIGFANQLEGWDD